MTPANLANAKIRVMRVTRYNDILAVFSLGSFLLIGACANRQPPPPGSVGEKLERAGENYQATEVAPTFRDARPNESAPVNR